MKSKQVLCSLLAMLLAGLAIFLPSCQTKKNTPEPRSDYAKELVSKDHFIDSAAAWTMITRYRTYRDSVGMENMPAARVLPAESESFNFTYMQKVMELDQALGLRIFFGMDDSYRLRLLIAGVDPDGNILYIDNGKPTTASVATKPPTGLAKQDRTDNGTTSSRSSSRGMVEMGQLP